MSALVLGAIINVSSGLGYALPAIIGLESMGIPSPGETALVLAAILASQGKLHISLVLVIGISSAIIGDNVGYWLGRRFGREVFVSRGPLRTHRRRAIEAGDQFFDRHGGKAVFFGRWIALVRFATAWLAGINRMPVLEFVFWNALGAISWGLTFGLVGYFGGNAAAHVLERGGVFLAVGLAVVAAAWVGWRWRRHRRSRG